MFDWLGSVRLADVDAVCWALAGLEGRSVPVTRRRANQWIARCRDAGLIETGRPTFRDGSVLWLAHHLSGRTSPDLHRQTTRHEVAVAAASARFLAHGYTWERDRRPVVKTVDHQADGVAVRAGERVLVEVELTPKIESRYRTIFRNHVDRNATAGVTAVAYFCTAAARAAVQREIDKRPDRHGFIHAVDVFDVRGRWREDAASSWPSLDAGQLAIDNDTASVAGFWGADE